MLMRRGDKQQKLQIEKLTTDFKDALQRYSDMQKVCDMRYVSNNCLDYKEFIIMKLSFCFNINNNSLQSIVEKMKRHILTMTNIENSMDGDDTEETHRLLLVQEQEHRTTQRFGNNIFCIHRKQWSICVTHK